MTLEWVFPQKKVQFLRIEIVTIIVIALGILFLTYLQFSDFFFGLLFTVIFVGVYVVLSYVTQLIRLVEERYHLTTTHFEVTRKTRFKTKTERVPLKDIRRHKLDHVFLGGYVVSKKKKHLVYFNTKKELKDFERFLKKHKKR